MIGVAEEVKANVQKDMIKSFIDADTQFIEKKHTGKMVSNLTRLLKCQASVVRPKHLLTTLDNHMDSIQSTEECHQ